MGRARLSLILLLFPLSVLSSTEGSLTVSPFLDYAYISNIFWDASQIKDSVLFPGISIDSHGKGFTLYLNADGRIYRHTPDLNSAKLNVGLEYFKTLSDKSSLFFSPDLVINLFRREFSDLNAFIPALTFGIKHNFSQKLFGRFGFHLHYSKFGNYRFYDHYQASGFSEINLFLKTQTLLRATFGLNYIHLPHLAESISGETVFPNDRGRRRGRNPIGGDPSSPIALSIPQPYVSFRISQALGVSTGLSGEIQYRRNNTEMAGVDQMISEEWALQQMNEDFFWEGPCFSMGVNTEISLGVHLTAELSYADKIYNGIVARDIQGQVITPESSRRDRLFQATVKFEKKFHKIGAYLHSIYRNNDSSDLYFIYDYFTIMTGLSYTF
jgi:hypothetical protein